MKKGVKMKLKLFYLTFIITFFISCSSKVNIAEIKNHPRQYVGKEVKVEGKVTDTYSLVFMSYFEVTDETGSIYVITDKPMPVKGERLKIEAKVQYFSLGTKQVISLKEK